MRSLKFKTNINCANCVASVSKSLDDIPGINWTVDTGSKDKVLLVEGSELDQKRIIEAVESKGFEIQRMGRGFFGFLK